MCLDHFCQFPVVNRSVFRLLILHVYVQSINLIKLYVSTKYCLATIAEMPFNSYFQCVVYPVEAGLIFFLSLPLCSALSFYLNTSVRLVHQLEHFVSFSLSRRGGFGSPLDCFHILSLALVSKVRLDLSFFLTLSCFQSILTYGSLRPVPGHPY